MIAVLARPLDGDAVRSAADGKRDASPANAENLGMRSSDGAGSGALRGCALRGPVAKHAQRIGLFHHVAHPLLRVDGRHLPDGGAGRQHFHQRKAKPSHLVLDGAADGAVCLRDLLVVAQAHARDVDRSFQCREQFAHPQRIAFGCRVAAVGRRRALLAEQRRGSSLAAGHAVDGVVDEDRRDVFAAIGSVQNLRRTDGRQVAVALVADHECCRGGCA